MLGTMLYIKHRDLMNQCSRHLDLDIMCKKELNQHYRLCESMCKIYGDTRSCYARFGPNTIGGYQTPYQLFDLETLTSGTKQSFDRVTDLRLESLQKRFDDRPWLVCWSGGIDSTVIVASLLRNLTKSQRSKITVFCNLDSVWLAPKFFTQFIKPNFQILDSTAFDVWPLLDRYLVIDGDLADYLWPSRFAYQLGRNAKNPWIHQRSLVDFFADKLGDDVGAKNFVAAVIENIVQTPVTCDTNADWLWWVNFNFKYLDGIMRKYYRGIDRPFADIHANYINWYHDQGYHSWALNHIQEMNYSLDISQHKKPAKQYVSHLIGDKCNTDTMVKIAAGFKEHIRSIKDCWLAIDQNKCYVSDAREIFLQ